MDADTILGIKPALTRYLHDFDGCMGRMTNRHHLQTYVAGQLSDLQRKWKRAPNFEPDEHRKVSHLVAKNNALGGVVHILSFPDGIHRWIVRIR